MHDLLISQSPNSSADVVITLSAIAGSVMLSNASGSIIDITAPKYLPLALSVLSFGPLNGPVLGPLIVSLPPILARLFIWSLSILCM